MKEIRKIILVKKRKLKDKRKKSFIKQKKKEDKEKKKKKIRFLRFFSPYQVIVPHPQYLIQHLFLFL